MHHRKLFQAFRHVLFVQEDSIMLDVNSSIRNILTKSERINNYLYLHNLENYRILPCISRISYHQSWDGIHIHHRCCKIFHLTRDCHTHNLEWRTINSEIVHKLLPSKCKRHFMIDTRFYKLLNAIITFSSQISLIRSTLRIEIATIITIEFFSS